MSKTFLERDEDLISYNRFPKCCGIKILADLGGTSDCIEPESMISVDQIESLKENPFFEDRVMLAAINDEQWDKGLGERLEKAGFKKLLSANNPRDRGNDIILYGFVPKKALYVKEDEVM